MKQLSTAGENGVTKLRSLFEEGARAMAFEVHRAPGFEFGRTIPTAPVAVGSLNMNELTLPPLPIAEGDIYVPPGKSATTVKLDAALIAQSRVAKAGAFVHVAAERPKQAPELGELALYRDVSELRRIVPADFSELADGAEIAESPLPILKNSVTWNGAGAPNVAFRVRVDRKTQKMPGGDVLEEQILHSIVSGLALQADKSLLTAILAHTPAAFSFGAAAARKICVDDLAALVGTDGAGAGYRGDGVFCAAGGVPAEFTASVAQTVIGAFEFSGVMIRPELLVHVERRDAYGDLVITCHAAMLPLVADPASFWVAA